MPTKFKDKDGKEIHQNSNIALPLISRSPDYACEGVQDKDEKRHDEERGVMNRANTPC